MLDDTGSPLPVLTPEVSPAPPRSRPSLSAPLLILAIGVLCLGAVGLVEMREQAQDPLRGSVLVFTDSAPWEGMIEARLRHLKPPAGSLRDELTNALEDMPEGKLVIDQFQLDRGPAVVYLDSFPPELESALAWGRLPEPGKPEVLAGDLASEKSITLDVVTFKVVGGLRRGVPVFLNSYVLPQHVHFNALFDDTTDAVTAWFDPDGAQKVAAQLGEQDSTLNSASIEGATARTRPWLSVVAILGLMLMAVGGALFQIRLLRRWAGPYSPAPVRRILLDMAEFPRLTIAIHVLLYACFFAAMFLAVALPQANLYVLDWTRYTFSKGELEYIGRAYESGNILQASVATFMQNYLTATLLAAMLPSFIIPCWAVLKNAFSFALVGFALSPLWVGTALNFTYHGITMVLEFEAYIVASIAVVMLLVHIFTGLVEGHIGRGLGRGLASMFTGAILAGLMLAISALYEATTLIVLGGR